MEEISKQFDKMQQQIFRNNYFLYGRQNVLQESFVVIDYKENPNVRKIIGGYAYDFIAENELLRTINYLTYVMPFTYGFDESGELIYADDERMSTSKVSQEESIYNISVQYGYIETYYGLDKNNKEMKNVCRPYLFLNMLRNNV